MAAKWAAGFVLCHAAVLPLWLPLTRPLPELPNHQTTNQTVTQTIAKTIARGFAVKTKFLGPTNHRGSRVCATYKRSSEQTYRATVDWDHQLRR